MPEKKRRRRGGPAAVDPNEARRRRLEARRQQKAEALAAQRRAQRRERLTRYFVLAGLFALAVWFFFFRNLAPDAIAGHPVEEFSSAGAFDHRVGEIGYESVPPVSGAHAPQAAACGVHDAPIPDPAQVHTLEHGAVGIQYAPELPVDDIRAIEAIVQDYDSHVFSAPYPGMPEPIAVTSWARMMRLDELDEEAIREYIEQFRGEGPEDNDCPNTSERPFDPSPSPSPTTTPAASPTDAGPGGGEGGRKKKND